MKKIIRLLINIVLISTIIFSGYNIYIKLNEYKKADEVYEDIRNISTSIEINKHDELLSKNNDYRLWINIENTNIDYPVVQGNDNEYYLTHDFNKNYLASGSIFMDYRNDFAKDNSVIIYGHHMRNKTMFGELTNFKKEEFINKNNLITIEDKDHIYTYEVFSVYVADLNNDDYLKVHFEDDKSHKNYLDYIKNRSLYKKDINLSTNDKILTLYTCSYEFKNARTIVHAKLISTK